MRRLSIPLLITSLAGLVTITSARAQEASGRFVGETTVNVIEVPVRVIDPATGSGSFLTQNPPWAVAE